MLEEEDQGEGGSAVQGEEERAWRGNCLLLLLRRGGLGLVQVRWHIVRQVGVQGRLGNRVEGWID